MVNINAAVIPESSITMREILQNREGLLGDTNRENSHKMQEIEKPQNKHENEVRRSGKIKRGIHRSQSELGSQSGSDEESSFVDRSNIDNSDDDDSKSDVDDTGSNDAQSGEESKEAQRTRVEKILSSIQDPTQFMDVDSMYRIHEVRRQKRKQNIPQQHERTAKLSRLEGQHYDEALWNHLNAVEYYFRHNDDTVPKQMNGFRDMDNIHRLHQAYFANISARHSEELQKVHNIQNKKLMAAFDRKLSSEKDNFDIAKHVRETVDANKALSQSFVELSEKELKELIESLKSKIEKAVSVTVDKELSNFFKKRNNYKTENSLSDKNRFVGEEINGICENEKRQTTDHSLNHILQMPDKCNSDDHPFRLLENYSAFELPRLKGLPEMSRAPLPQHLPHEYPPISFYLSTSFHHPSLYSCPIVSPEQTEALSLVVNIPKKKRTKVTDTRLSPRAERALLQENGSLRSILDHERTMSTGFGQVNLPSLPTSVAIFNPSLQHSDILNCYMEQSICTSPWENDRNTPCSSNTPSENGYNFVKEGFFSDSDGFNAQGKQTTDTLTPMHLRKAKLMFFYVRYPSSTILNAYFPDVQFNKNNTAQLVKWFSNFREFYYIQMEKYARQSIAEGCKHAEDLEVTVESELYRVLNLHYNRNNQIEVSENFRITVQATLREFYTAILDNKDAVPSWKKPIYKVIARMDDIIPEYFKSPNWMDHLGKA